MTKSLTNVACSIDEINLKVSGVRESLREIAADLGDTSLQIDESVDGLKAMLHLTKDIRTAWEKLPTQDEIGDLVAKLNEAVVLAMSLTKA